MTRAIIKSAFAISELANTLDNICADDKKKIEYDAHDESSVYARENRCVMMVMRVAMMIVVVVCHFRKYLSDYKRQ